MNLKKLTPVLVAGTILVSFMIFSNLNTTNWPPIKVMPSDEMAKSSLVKNISYDQAEMLIGIWLGLILLGGFLLVHIRLRTLKEEAK